MAHQRHPHSTDSQDILLTAGSLSLLVHPLTLQSYLPTIPPSRAHINLNHLLFRHQPPHNLPPAQQQIIHDTLETLLRSLSRNSARSEATSLDLLAFLESGLREKRTTFFRFATIAQVAKLTKSPRLFAVLSQFFVKYSGYLIGGVGEDVVAEWCRIIVGCFGPAERVGLLREVVVCREDLIEDLRVAGAMTGVDVGGLVKVVGDVIGRIGGGKARGVKTNTVPTEMERRGRPRTRSQGCEMEDPEYRRRPRQSTHRRRPRQSTQVGWTENEEPASIMMPCTPMSPRQPRTPMQPRFLKNVSNARYSPFAMQMGMRQRENPCGKQDSERRWRDFEQRLYEAEEAIIWIAAKGLNLEGGLQVWPKQLQPWSEDEYAFV